MTAHDTAYAPLDTGGIRNGGVSHRHTALGLAVPGPALARDVTCDVAIVGGALTGLWTGRARVRAPYVLRCLEGFTAGLTGHRRDWLPMNSAIIVTAPLTDAQRSVITGGRARSCSVTRRTPTDLALGYETTRTSVPWVGHAGRRSRSVSPEPDELSQSVVDQLADEWWGGLS